MENKKHFIKKSLRPPVGKKSVNKNGEKSVKELGEILGNTKKKAKRLSDKFIPPIIKRFLDSKEYKDYKDHKDLIYEGPLNVKGIEKSLAQVIKKVSKLESEVKKLRKK